MGASTWNVAAGIEHILLVNISMQQLKTFKNIVVYCHCISDKLNIHTVERQ